MTTLTPEAVRQARTLLTEFTYELHPVERGYANRTLYIDLSTNTVRSKPVTQQMKDIFTGGRGFCLWLLWNGTTGETRWDSPGKRDCDRRWGRSAASPPIRGRGNRL